jgi:YVTN family beta-propeller protein
MYVGDVNSVKVIDTATQKVTKTIPVSANGFRVDEGCYDAADNLVMFASPDDPIPFATFISTKTQSIVGHLDFKDSAGLEDCKYDPKSKAFDLNDDGTPKNPTGQIDVIPASSVAAGAPTVSNSAPLGDCNPTGMVLGPNNEMLVGCNPPKGKALTSLILDRTSLATIAKVPFAGVDQVDYDAASNKYFLAANHWVPGGVAAAAGQVPTLGVVDGATHALSYTVAAGGNGHSVAVDSASGQVYIPFAPGVAAFPDGGIQVVTTP